MKLTSKRVRPAMAFMFALSFTFTLALDVAASEASTVSLETVKGKSTLTVLAEKREENSIRIALTDDRKHVRVEDNGLLPDFSEVPTRLDPKAEPGCGLETPFEGLPELDFVLCDLRKIDQALVNTGDGGDSVKAGDGYEKGTIVKFPMYVQLGPGIDFGIGGNGNDFLVGGGGRDGIEGGKGNDSVSGGAGVDTVTGDESYFMTVPRNGGNDVMIGGGGRDYIYPGSGRDKVIAGGGNDLISSVRDKDRDTIDCGAGRNDHISGVDNKGIRFKENIAGCETFVDETFGDYYWTCRGRKCKVEPSVYRSLRAPASRLP